MKARETSNKRHRKWSNCVIKIPRIESRAVFEKHARTTNERVASSVSNKKGPSVHTSSRNLSERIETNRRVVLSPKKTPENQRATRSATAEDPEWSKLRMLDIMLRKSPTKHSTVHTPANNLMESASSTDSGHPGSSAPNSSTISSSENHSTRQEPSTTSSRKKNFMRHASNSDPLVQLSRRETFSASHRLYNPDLTPEQNLEIYDKCNNLHGHNYVVYVVLKGPIDPQTGMVYNMADLKRELEEVLGTLDHKNLDVDVEFFKNRVSTVENIALYILNTLKLSKPELLHKIKVLETEKNAATVYLN